uniref:E2F-associated phosphoprotein n=1 Tax=Steinernema glaseri TaxID=37863 RepID=A0A1I7ZLL2_9BILA
MADPAEKDESERRMEQEASGEIDFYDEDEDEDNERWIRQKQLNERYVVQRELPPTKKSKKRVEFDDMAEVDRQKAEGDFADEDFSTDALLSCPSCMIVLTRDCQRHAVYKDQYRAMFVENCQVDMEERLFVPQKQSKLVKRKKDKAMTCKSILHLDASEEEPIELTAEELDKCDPSDIFFPVRCAQCKVQVGMYDHDEIYHFFNVLAGYS